MDLSIVIVSYNVREMLRDCLRALPEATAGLSIEVFVVDNASSDGSAAMVRDEFPSVRLTASAENLGFTRGNNVALKHSGGRYVLLLNPDTEAEPESLTRLVRFMDAHPAAGACGPKLLNTDGSLQPNGKVFPTPWGEFVAVSGLRRLVPRRFERVHMYGRLDLETLCQVDQVSGACLLVRVAVMEQVGMLDERFFMFYEEVEWCHRIKAAGHQIWYVPEARVTHHWMGSVRQQSRKMTAELYRSQVRYYEKTAGPAVALAMRLVAGWAIGKNELLHLGVAAKARLRRLGLVR